VFPNTLQVDYKGVNANASFSNLGADEFLRFKYNLLDEKEVNDGFKLLKKNKLQWFKFADLVAPLLILGYAIGRIGCLLVGDDYGKPTHLPWGISFPDGLPPSTYRIFQTYYPWINLEGFDPGVLTVHPTQIYETILGFGIFYFLYKKRKSVTVAGSLFFTYLIFAGSERFFIEFLRVNTRYLFGLSGSQIISLGMIAIGSWFLTHPVSAPQEEPSEK